ncbi:type II secretion system F family protein [Actinacidiphila oryziradicis]|uniref:Type II secretion protein F n=1 Tax=Actinacidiphila oryziradicis TaxID=2571141 RepID=A0A4U0SQ61_9ACTN|nr:type II secretion system F family protein [Actinacidiphila oryziradicis]TKA12066.1 type II secretion protein F [Actinacidiphila oryziradicis]
MIAILLGATFGGGLLALAYGLHPPRPSLAASLAALHRPVRQAAAPTAAEAEPGGWAARWGRRGVPLLRALGLPTASLRQDLAVLGMDVDRHLAEKAAAAAVGLIAPPALLALVDLGTGAGVGWWLPTWVALLCAGALFLAPDLTVRAQARRRRAEMRHTLAVFLDLVVIALAGGAGVQQALADAAAAPQGWAASQLRRALATAQLARSSVWDELGALGRQTGVSELSELAATVGLAGSEGARIRTSLEAKAAAMRGRRLAEADGAAQSATERMALPVVLKFGAFLIFIGYPALTHVLSGL